MILQVCHLVAKIGLKIRMQLSCKSFRVLLPADFDKIRGVKLLCRIVK